MKTPTLNRHLVGSKPFGSKPLGSKLLGSQCAAAQPVIHSHSRQRWTAWFAALLLAVSLMLHGTPLQAKAPAWEVFVPKAGEVGSGQFRYWGFLVYDASLWSPQGQYRPNEPFALSLRYARAVSKSDIVKASIDQMRDQGIAVDRHPEWTVQLSKVMESVEAGDTLTGVYTPGQGAVFFYNDGLTGQVDERLAQAFFAIWLDPKTSQPKLRQALLGQAQ